MPMICGWCDPDKKGICSYFMYPLRTLVFSEFVFVEIVGVALVVGGIKAIL